MVAISGNRRKTQSDRLLGGADVVCWARLRRKRTAEVIPQHRRAGFDPTGGTGTTNLAERCGSEIRRDARRGAAATGYLAARRETTLIPQRYLRAFAALKAAENLGLEGNHNPHAPQRSSRSCQVRHAPASSACLSTARYGRQSAVSRAGGNRSDAQVGTVPLGVIGKPTALASRIAVDLKQRMP